MAGTLSLGAAGTVIGLLLALFFSGGQRVVAYTLLGAFIGVVAGFVIGGFLGPRGTGHVEDESI